MPDMSGFEDTSALQPIQTRRSLRRDRWRGITSGRAGQVIPVAYFPLLREDRIRGRINLKVNMSPTVRTLLNAVKVKATAYLYPFSIDENFNGMDDFNASYQGVSLGGAPVKTFVPKEMFNTKTRGMIYNTLGVHVRNPSTATYASWITRAYNSIINTRRAQRSTKLVQRVLTDQTQARCFWMEPDRFAIVPDFDHAQLEGELLVPLRGVVDTSGATVDLSVAGRSSVSMADLRLVRETQAWARLKDAYADRTDEYLIDLLLEGIRVPEDSLREPQLLGAGTATIGMTERYASDGASLGDYQADGETQITLDVMTPAINPGGLVLVCVEIMPEAMPEWGMDHFVTIFQPSDYPNYMRDELDPEKVSLILNRDIDAHHSDPNGVFGYTSINNKWNRNAAHLGGKFYADSGDAWSEDRARVWQVKRTNPKLDSDWYLAPSPFPHDPFADTTADPFEIITLADMQIVGNTVFSPRLRENRDSFGEIIGQVDQSRYGHAGHGGTAPSPMVSRDVEKAVDEAVGRAPRRAAAVKPPVDPVDPAEQPVGEVK